MPAAQVKCANFAQLLCEIWRLSVQQHFCSLQPRKSQTARDDVKNPVVSEVEGTFDVGGLKKASWQAAKMKICIYF